MTVTVPRVESRGARGLGRGRDPSSITRPRTVHSPQRSNPRADRPDPFRRPYCSTHRSACSASIARLRPAPARRSAAAVTLQRRSISIARRRRRAGRSVVRALSGERTRLPDGGRRSSPSRSPSATSASKRPGGPTGNTNGAGTGPRIALGGAVSGLENAPQGGIDDVEVAGTTAPERTATWRRTGRRRTDASLGGGEQLTIDGPFDCRRHPAQAGLGRHDRGRRQGPAADLPGQVRRHADRDRPPVPRLDDDRVVGQRPQVQGRRSTSARPW